MNTRFKIEGLHCQSCKALIEDVALDAPGVIVCTVDVAAGSASIEHTDAFDPSAFAAEVAKLDGYKVVAV